MSVLSQRRVMAKCLQRARADVAEDAKTSDPCDVETMAGLVADNAADAVRVKDPKAALNAAAWALLLAETLASEIEP